MSQVFYTGAPLFVGGAPAHDLDCCCGPTVIPTACLNCLESEFSTLRVLANITGIMNSGVCANCPSLNGPYYLDFLSAGQFNPDQFYCFYRYNFPAPICGLNLFNAQFIYFLSTNITEIRFWGSTTDFSFSDLTYAGRVPCMLAAHPLNIDVVWPTGTCDGFTGPVGVTLSLVL